MGLVIEVGGGAHENLAAGGIVFNGEDFHGAGRAWRAQRGRLREVKQSRGNRGRRTMI